MDAERSSGISWRLALYAGNSRWRLVGAAVSNTTAIWVGLCVFNTSNKGFVKPIIAPVLSPYEVSRGTLLNAQYAREISAIPSSKTNLFLSVVVLFIYSNSIVGGG